MRALLLAALLLTCGPAAAQMIGPGGGGGGGAPSGPAGGDLGSTYPNPTVTGVGNVTAGVLAAAHGGAGTITGALKGNGSGVVSQAACADLSNATASCSTDTTSASNISAGTLAAARGGAGTISGALKGNGSGVVSQAACADLSNAAASCATDATNATNIGSGTLNVARLPALGSANRLAYTNGTPALASSASAGYFDTAIFGSTPSAPTSVLTGSAGSFHYTYAVVAVGGLGYGQMSAISSPAIATIFPLTGGNFITVTAPACVSGATSYDVFEFFAEGNPGQYQAYVGNVACSGSIVDNGTYAATVPASGSQPYPQVDNSAGVKIGQNLIVAGNVAIGTAPLGRAWLNTSGNIPLSVAQTLTGTSAANSALDGANIQSIMTILPAASGSLGTGATNYAFNGYVVVPSGAGSATIGDPVVYFADMQVLSSENRNYGQIDGIWSFVQIGGSVATSSPAKIYGIQSGGTISTSGTIDSINMFYGTLSSFSTITTANIYDAAASVSHAMTNLTSFHVEVPTGSTHPGTYTGLLVEDVHATGTTSYAIHTVGALSQSLFEGPVRTNSVFDVSGTDGVTCAAGTPSSSFATAGGIVTHC